MAAPIPFFEPRMGEAEQAAIAAVIARAFPNDGPEARRLEAHIAGLAERRDAVAVTSCTAGISLALMAAGIGPGDEVLVPALTFVATANAVRMTGATPVLVDICEPELGMDPERAAEALTPRTRALVAVHISGRPARIDALQALCEAHGLFLVEDAAEALGSQRGKRPLGNFGDAAVFSFTANKLITCGQGGVVVADDPALLRRLRALKNQGRDTRGTGGNDLHPSLGFNFKLTDLQAAMALAQLQSLSARVAHRRALYCWYASALDADCGLRLLPTDVHGGAAPLWIDAVCEHDDRDALVAALKAEDLHCRPFWRPVHEQPPYRDGEHRYPVAERISRRALWLPSDLGMSEDSVARVADALRRATHALHRKAS